MSTSESTRGRRATVAWRTGLVAVLALGLAAAGCSKSDPPPPSGLNTTLPGNKGASCVDGKGDIATYSEEGDGTLSSPAGIDLVAAKATLTESTLQVQFDTAGPIDGTPQPEYIVFQGDPTETKRWELKARQNVDTKAWELLVTTFEKDSQGRFVETPTKLTTAVKVEGTKLSYEVSQKDIPPAASYVWAFGSSSGVDPNTLSDYCDNSTGASTGTTTPGTTPASTTPTTLATGALRQSQTTKRGETVTVYSVESPPQSPNAGATPPDPTPEQLPGDPTPVPFKLALIDARVCAPAGQPLTTATLFFVKDQNGNNWGVHEVAVSAHDPAMPTTLTLAANECKQAWVTLQLPETSTVTQVIYSVDRGGTDALLWNAG